MAISIGFNYKGAVVNTIAVLIVLLADLCALIIEFLGRFISSIRTSKYFTSLVFRQAFIVL
jgi:hypothetical protein